MKTLHRAYSCVAALMLLAASRTQAHTWVEELSVIGSNGTFVGSPGFPRGFIQRNAPTFADFNLINQIPPNGRSTGNAILPTDLICRASQFIGNQTAGNPRLSAAPGDHVALVYAENGHVTLLQNTPTKPVGSGTVFIYGTKRPSNNDTYLGIHRVWNTAGTGGDQRAPLDAGNLGLYTLYYVWEWPTLSPNGAVTTNESYTTCMDIEMIAKSQIKAAISFDVNQPIDSAGIQTQLSSQYLINPTQPPQLTTTTVLAGTKSLGMTNPASSNVQVSGFVTVTVTAPGTFVTVTNTVEVIAASAQSKSQSIIIPIPPTTNPFPARPQPTSLRSSSVQVSSSSTPPKQTSSIAPSQSQGSKAIAVSPQAASTTTSKQTTTIHQVVTTTAVPTFSLIPTAAATSDSQDMTSDASSARTVTRAQETAITYLNGTS